MQSTRSSKYEANVTKGSKVRKREEKKRGLESRIVSRLQRLEHLLLLPLPPLLLLLMLPLLLVQLLPLSLAAALLPPSLVQLLPPPLLVLVLLLVL